MKRLSLWVFLLGLGMGIGLGILIIHFFKINIKIGVLWSCILAGIPISISIVKFIFDCIDRHKSNIKEKENKKEKEVQELKEKEQKERDRFRLCLLYYINDGTPYISLLGTGKLDDNGNEWTVIHTNHNHGNCDSIPYSFVLKNFLKQYIDESKITHINIFENTLYLRDNQYIERKNNLENFSFKLNVKGIQYVNSHDINRFDI